MHLIQEANTLGAEIELAAGASIVRLDDNGDYLTDDQVSTCRTLARTVASAAASGVTSLCECVMLATTNQLMLSQFSNLRRTFAALHVGSLS